jgi:hypothetical protein
MGVARATPGQERLALNRDCLMRQSQLRKIVSEMLQKTLNLEIVEKLIAPGNTSPHGSGKGNRIRSGQSDQFTNTR